MKTTCCVGVNSEWPDGELVIGLEFNDPGLNELGPFFEVKMDVSQVILLRAMLQNMLDAKGECYAEFKFAEYELDLDKKPGASL